MNLPLPKETKDYFGNNENRVLKISNLGLLFNKYIYSWQDNWQMEEKNSKEFRETISKMTFAKEYVYAVYNRQNSIIQGLRSSGYHIESISLATDSRLIIGLGGTSVIETGMTLHPLYGFPYLPGSGLKGLARAYAEIAVEPKPSGEELKEIFGSEDKKAPAPDNIQGRVFFMDGLPLQFPKLDLDIMNPHYGEYYRGEKPPADYLNPVPVTFLAVAAGQPFSFAVFSRNKDLTEKAKSWLIGGLTELGAGGKTNVGYGYFKIDGSQQVHAGSSAKNPEAKQSALSVETIKWENATLTWSPGNQVLKATKDNIKAELKVSDRSIVPAEHHNSLFVKRKSIIANVIVEKIGNKFIIVKIGVNQ
jgi:CRISPR-associated protein Cmr6